MGKIADRLAQRNDPTRVAARTLVKYAAAAANTDSDEDIDQVQGLMNALLASMPPEDFDQFQGVLEEEVMARHDADDVARALSTTLQVACEFAEHAQEGTTQLCALPLMVIDSPRRQDLNLSEAQLQSITAVLHEHCLVEPEARLTPCPTLLRIEDASGLMAGHVFRLIRHLNNDDVPSATQVLEEGVAAARQAMGESGESEEAHSDSDEGRHLTLGVLVFAVTSDDLEVFPLTSEFDAVTDAEDVTAEAEDEAYADLRHILTRASAEIAKILGAEEVRLVAEPRGWAAGVRSALQAERSICTQIALRDTAAEHAGGDETALCVDTESLRLDENEFGQPAIFVPVLLKKSRAEVAELQWPLMPPETPVECMDDLTQFFETAGVAMLSDLPAKPDKPAFSVISNTRH